MNYDRIILQLMYRVSKLEEEIISIKDTKTISKKDDTNTLGK